MHKIQTQTTINNNNNNNMQKRYLESRRVAIDAEPSSMSGSLKPPGPGIIIARYYSELMFKSHYIKCCKL